MWPLRTTLGKPRENIWYIIPLALSTKAVMQWCPCPIHCPPRSRCDRRLVAELTLQPTLGDASSTRTYMPQWFSSEAAVRPDRPVPITITCARLSLAIIQKGMSCLKTALDNSGEKKKIGEKWGGRTNYLSHGGPQRFYRVQRWSYKEWPWVKLEILGPWPQWLPPPLHLRIILLAVPLWF